MNRIAPANVRKAAREGWRLHESGYRGGTKVGWARARQLSGGREVSDNDVLAMYAYFARHAVDRRPWWKNPPTPGYVAWMLWGGDAGRSWATRERKKLKAAGR